MGDKHGRHPLGRRCGDPRILLTAILLMPYAMVRYGIDSRRERRR